MIEGKSQAPVQQQSIQRLQSYAWYNLASGPLSLTFTSDGTWAKQYLIFSVSGCETSSSLRIYIDNVQLPWSSSGTLDRQFYPYIFNFGLSAGTHTLRFEGTLSTTGQIRQVCNVNLHEYKDESLFKFDNDFVGAYPTWSSSNRLTYRPSNEICLMRNMSSPVFCRPCVENIWLQFLRRISLIDQVTVTGNDTFVNVSVIAIPLAQLRDEPVLGERYTVTWSRGGVVDVGLNDVFSWARPRSSVTGSWAVTIKFTTLEIRSDPTNLTTSRATFTI